MPGRRKDEVSEVLDYETAHSALLATMERLHLSRLDEMPRIELYRDQLLALVTIELTPFYADGEKIITGSMVNNYVKQGAIPAPTRKRYTSRHLALLLIVCTLKRVIPIAQVARLLELCREEHLALSPAYDLLAGYLEEGLRQRFIDEGDAPTRQFPLPQLTNEDGVPISNMLASLLQAALILVIDKVYLERMLSLEGLRAQAGPAELN